MNVYCPESIGHPGGQQKRFLPFGHGRDLAAFMGTGLQSKSFQDWAEISITKGLNLFGTRKMTRASGAIRTEHNR